MSADDALHVRIDIARQELSVWQGGSAIAFFPVSTALKGPGEENGSEQTPRGTHYVRARIGEGLPPGAVLKGRRFTGEVWTRELEAVHPGRDWILSRILWLCGREIGRNRLGKVDTMRRYIYIHGTPDTEPMGVPRSHGCIRMRNDDVIRLFDMLKPGTRVDIA